MGNTSLSNQFKSGKWKTIETIGNRQVLENIETKIQVQKHFAISDFKSFDDRFSNTELYNWRKSLDQNANVVRLYEFEIKEARFGIQEDQYVYTEKIHRVNQKGKRFSKAQGFLLILDLLTGLDILFSTFDFFNIDIFLLGISESGRGKVWINNNYAKNSIDESNLIQVKTQTTELIIVNNLIRLIKDKVYNDNFMPEIEFPSNMYLNTAIQYINAVRKDHVLFRVDKIYLNRDQFKQHYDMLQKSYLNSIQAPQVITHFQTPSHNIQPNSPNPKVVHNPHLFRVQTEERRLERQKSISIFKVKNQPSQTLSSDSNSRSKKQNYNLLNLHIEPKRPQHQIIHHHEKIHLKDMVNQQKISSVPNEESNTSHGRFIREDPNFTLNEKIPDTIGGPSVFQQRVILPLPNFGNIQNQNPHIVQQKIEENVPLQFQQRQMIPIDQFPQQFKHKQIIQRNIVSYRPLNSDQRQNLRQILGSTISHQSKAPLNQKIFLPQNSQPLRHPLPQTLQNVIVSQPLENQNFNSQPIGIKKNLAKKFMETEENDDEQFINNVELCESVIFDRGQIERNMADL